MAFKKLFQATFEQSLRLRQDGLTSYMIKDTDGRKFYRNSLLKSIFSILGILILYGMTAFVDAVLKGNLGRTTVDVLKINLLPTWLFFLCLAIWLFIWQWTIRKRYEAIVPYFSILNGYSYNIWLLLFLNLLFIPFFANPMTPIGLLIFGILNLFICIWIIRMKLRSLTQLLFGAREKAAPDFIDKIINLIIKYGWILVVAWLLLRFIFPDLRETRADLVGLLSVAAMWFAYNIGITAAMMYLFFPHALAGYYMYKYPEEYRMRAEKSPEEWYGKKYLKKHGDQVRSSGDAFEDGRTNDGN